MRIKTALWVIAALSATCGGVYFFGLQSEAEQNVVQIEGASALPIEGESSASLASPSGKPAELTKPSRQGYARGLGLPAIDAQLLGVVDDLASRSAKGEPQAACRLSYELARCGEASRMRAMAEDAVANAARSAPGSETEAKLTASASVIHQSALSVAAICEGVDLSKYGPAWEPMYAAAKSGHNASAVRFIMRPPLDEAGPANDAAGWSAYAESAAPLLQRLLQSGDPRGAYIAALAYRGFPMPGGAQFVDVDYRRSLVYARIARSFADAESAASIDRIIASAERHLTAEEIELARSEAGKLLTDTFRPADDSIDFDNDLVPADATDCERN